MPKSQRALDKKDCKREAKEDMITLNDGTKIQVLPITDHIKYLGQQLNLVDHTDNDIDERIRKG